ncbi:uncharacterized protein LOC115734802 [Rhodamnia argentea]|uniref:Uncharacterized protein LOC115734802 n=1 Tax=Rhodamnia argentea TaxID=178133 RepID=A0A8B8NHF9_9MYRT|nr:uncharacterized protein LOC115734802 [Rhodamnia argentea]
MSPSSRSCGHVSGTANGYGYIEHQVFKMDTLAGIAIKYGVEVADIKRVNGLATDFQIFALKTLRIPLPGRHPPSASLPSGAASSGDKSAEKASSSTGHCNSSKSSELFKWTSCIHSKRLKGQESPASDSSSKFRQKDTGFPAEDGSIVDYASIFDVINAGREGCNTKPTRSCQETETGYPNATPGKLLKKGNSGGNGSFLATRGKDLALRAKSASRTSLTTDAQSNCTNSTRAGAQEDIIANEHPRLGKASSLLSLVQTNSSSIRQTSKWSLKPDIPLFSAASLTGPILDGLSLPTTISGWRSKAALD